MLSYRASNEQQKTKTAAAAITKHSIQCSLIKLFMIDVLTEQPKGQFQRQQKNITEIP
jgi:hypothetical protein